MGLPLHAWSKLRQLSQIIVSAANDEPGGAFESELFVALEDLIDIRR